MTCDTHSYRSVAQYSRSKSFCEVFFFMQGSLLIFMIDFKGVNACGLE